MRRFLGLATAALLLLGACKPAPTRQTSAPTQGAQDWAFQGRAPSAPSWSKTQRIALYDAASSYTQATVHDGFTAIDWRPGDHPSLPPIVASGRPPGVMACGYCHLPAGEGRPENAALAGLPQDYILRQVHAFASGARTSAKPGWLPTVLMTKVARGVTPQELQAAAAYFSARPFTSHVRVVETAQVQAPIRASFLLTPDPHGAVQPLGARIFEGPASLERFEQRDPLMAYVAYVPLGSLKRGDALAHGAQGVQACSACHGADLKGGIGPPLAGRSPSYIFRQLYAFKTGARSDADAAPMKAVTAPLAPADMIALAAYAASQKP